MFRATMTGTTPIEPAPPRACCGPTQCWLAAVAAAALILVSFCYDARVVAWVSAVQQPGLKSVATWVSRLGDWPPLATATALAWLAALAAGSRRWLRILALVLLASLLAGAVVNPLRIVTGRARPDATVPQGWYGVSDHGKSTMGRHQYSSFPSAHTTVAFAMAMPFLILAGRRGRVALAVAAAIGLSRIYLNVHHLSDVLTGAALGSICGIIVCRWSALTSRLDRCLARVSIRR